MLVQSSKVGNYYIKTTTITHDCKCLEFKARRNRYENGQKSCYRCGIFMNYEGNHCPCCHTKLRCNSRSYKRKDVKRI